MHYVLYFAICLIATTVGAISGVGGGVIIKPFLDAVSGMSVKSISFMSGCTVLAMSIVSLIRSRGGDVKLEPKRATPLAIGAALGGVAGKFIFDIVKRASDNDGLIGTVQSIIMIILTGGVLLYVIFKSRIRSYNIKNYFVSALVGLLLGVMSAFLGIGGGPINLAVLYFFFSMDTKTASLNSIYIILFSQTASFITTLVMRDVPTIDWITLGVMIVGGIAGGILGRSISRKLSNKAVDRIFMVLLSVITLISVYNLIKYLTVIG